MWYRIELKRACFGIRETGGIIVESAPIGKWMLGKPIALVTQWVKNINGKIDPLNDINNNKTKV